MINEYTIIHKSKSIPKLQIVREINDNVFSINCCEQYAMLMLKTKYYMDMLDSENMYLLMFNGRDVPLGIYHVSKGDYNSCGMYNRTIATVILLLGAKQFLLAHNHPEAELIPSRADKGNDAALYGLGRLLGIDYLGSYIINKNGYIKIGEKEPTDWNDII